MNEIRLIQIEDYNLNELFKENKGINAGECIVWDGVQWVVDYPFDPSDLQGLVHIDGDETINDKKTFTSSPIVPDATLNNQAVNLGQVESRDYNLQQQINNIVISIANGLVFKGVIDASLDPNYPVAEKGDVYVIQVKGKIGGANGVEVSVGNTLICLEDTQSGTQLEVGENWVVLQSDLDQATETVLGFARIAKEVEVDAGVDDSTIITPFKLKQRFDKYTNEVDNKFIRYDINNQGLSSIEQGNARENIGAASLIDLEWASREW